MNLPAGIQKIVDGGYCIGCGACASISSGESIAMEMSAMGVYLPVPRSGTPGQVDPLQEYAMLRVCPFSDESRDEDQLAGLLFPDVPHHSSGTGKYLQCYVGRVAEDDVYHNSSSGGLSRWLLAELLERDKVDYVVNVVPRSEGGAEGLLFRYAVHVSGEQVMKESAKSAYYPVEMSQMVGLIKNQPGRYAITGVPCFIKALRNIALVDERFRDRIKFTCGVICGHQKSTWYAEMIAWQLGVPPQELGAIDFRVKIPGAKANEKGVQAWSKAGKPGEGPKIVQDIFGTTYAHGFFKNAACEFCDDVTAELADISFGDAWLPEYLSQGTSLVIVRNAEINEILKEGISRSVLCLKPIDAAAAETAQAGGLRDRREGLSYRLATKQRNGLWTPRKRVPASFTGISTRRRKIYRMRTVLSVKSFEFFKTARERGDWNYFVSRMRPLVGAYSRSHASIFRRVISKICRTVGSVFPGRGSKPPTKG
jgi:coenzyme F420-reducing hydrogenase beta subunit